MTPEEEKELLELEAQIIRLKMLNNQYSRRLLKKQPSKSMLGQLNFGTYFSKVELSTWKAFITPNTMQNKILMLVITSVLAFLKKKRS